MEEKRKDKPLHKRIQEQDNIIRDQDRIVTEWIKRTDFWKDRAKFYESRSEAFEEMGKFLIEILKKNYSKLDEEDRDKVCACESFCQFAEFLDEVYKKC